MKQEDLIKELKGYTDDLVEQAALKQQLKALDSKIKSRSVELYDKMDEAGVEKIDVDGVEFKKAEDRDFVLGPEYKGQKWDDVEEWFSWLEDTGNGELIKTKRSVHSSTRKSFLASIVEAAEEPLPEFIRESFFNHVKHKTADIKAKI